MRLARWVVGGVLCGLIPFLLAYGIRSYYGGHAPPLRDVLGNGDGTLVVVSWCVVALLELSDTSLSARWELAMKSVALVLVAGAAVAYGCLTADSVTGRVQTPRQTQMVTALSLAGLALAAIASSVAVAARPKEESTR